MIPGWGICRGSTPPFSTLRRSTMTKRTMVLDGMTCGPCVGSVQRALLAVAGVTVEQVTVGAAAVTFDRA